MKIISPSTILPLVYLIQDHTDSNTYYVRSVIKDTRSGTVLKTVDLTDGGNRRFTGTFSVPTAEETYIDITTTVYSDAGYTTKAQDKYEENSQYLVKTQWGLQFGGVGGGSSERIDYKKIQKMIEDSLSKIEKVKEYDDSMIMKKMDEMHKCISMIETPDMTDMKPIPVNFAPMMSKFSEISKVLDTIIQKSDEIFNKEVEKPEVFDYEKIISAVSQVKDQVENSIKQIENNMDKKENILKNIMPKIKASLKEVENLVANPDYDSSEEESKTSFMARRMKNLMGKE